MSKINLNQSINCLLMKNEKKRTKKLKKTIDGAYESSEDYIQTKKRNVLIVFDDMIADMEANKKLSSRVTKLFFSGRKFNFLLVFYHDLI